jgi:hypothetical protein
MVEEADASASPDCSRDRDLASRAAAARLTQAEASLFQQLEANIAQARLNAKAQADYVLNEQGHKASRVP